MWLAATSLSCIIISCIGFTLHRYLVVVDHYECYCDQHIACDEQKKVRSFLEQYMTTSKAVSLSTVVSALHDQFPYIESVAVQKLPIKTMMVTIRGGHPSFRINNDKILTRQGLVLAEDFFNVSCLKFLPHINIAACLLEEKTKNGFLMSSLLCIPATFFEHFKITWLTMFEMWLHDKRYPQFHMLCTLDNFSKKTMMHHYKTMRGILQKRGTSSKIPLEWVVDMRFQDQIIVFAKKGG